MSFETGSTALMICPLNGELPEDFLECFAKYKGGMLDDVKQEAVLGWVSGRHLLENQINELTSICGGHLYVNLRKAERKLPAQLLRAICRREELAYMQANDMLMVPKAERNRIKEDAIEKNLRKMPPTISAVPIVVDKKNNIMYIGNASQRAYDQIAAEFMKDVGVEPVPMSVAELMIRCMKASETDLPALSFSSKDDGEPVPGRDFLTWLWYHAETAEGKIVLGGISYNLMIEGPLTFAFAADEAKGASESVLKKGCPQISAEAKAALSVGKKLKKAKIMLAREGSDRWTFTFDADSFTMTGLTLPEGEEMDIHSQFEERIGFIHLLVEALEGYFTLFATTVMDPEKRSQLEEDMRTWAEERESF